MAGDATVDLLLVLCRGELDDAAREQVASLLAGPVDWDELAELAALHGVVGLVRGNLAALGGEQVVAQAAWLNIQRAATQITFDGLVHASRLVEVVSALHSAGLKPLALKGVALAALLYHDAAVRPSTDLDILLRPEEMDSALAVLRELGARTPRQAEIDFQRRHSYDLGCVLPPLVGRAMLVELHWDLAPRGLFTLDLDRWRQRAQTFNLDGVAVQRFAPEEQLLHLALHMRKHRYVGLRWLADVSELLRRFPDLDWQYVASTAESSGLQTLLFTTLSLAVQLLGAPAPEPWLERLTPSAARRRLLHSVLHQDGLLRPLETADADWTRLALVEVLLLDRPAAMARELRFRLWPPIRPLAGDEAAEPTAGLRLLLLTGRLAQRTATLLRRSQ